MSEIVWLALSELGNRLGRNCRMKSYFSYINHPGSNEEREVETPREVTLLIESLWCSIIRGSEEGSEHSKEMGR